MNVPFIPLPVCSPGRGGNLPIPAGPPLFHGLRSVINEHGLACKPEEVALIFCHGFKENIRRSDRTGDANDPSERLTLSPDHILSKPGGRSSPYHDGTFG
jgi:hypothetical protein